MVQSLQHNFLSGLSLLLLLLWGVQDDPAHHFAPVEDMTQSCGKDVFEEGLRVFELLKNKLAFPL